jgi:hypothetical protein
MRNVLVIVWVLLWSITSASAQLSVGIGLPGVSIGINLPVYPQLVPVPGYPVYYAPQVSSNYFFYDGMYWVYQRDSWYASSWYNGPWGLVAPEAVPLFVLRIPVRYYRQPPVYFRGWQADAPPRWGEHWGPTWVQRRQGWDHWDRNAAYRPAPLPAYQRQYSGTRYPRTEQQQALQSQNYRYQPQDAVVQQHYQAQQVRRAAAPQGSQQARPERGSPPQVQQQPHPQQRQQPKTQAQRQQQGPDQHQQQAPGSQGQDKRAQGRGSAPQSNQGQEKQREQGDAHGGGRGN